MRSFPIMLAAGILAAAIVPAQAQFFREVPNPTYAATNLAGLHDFDFLIGEWSVHHPS
jgi:hypothetical protein